MASDPKPDAFRLLTWIGIIEQLTRNAADRSLKTLGLTYPEFSMLVHFSHGRPPEKTVTGIAAAMQLLQPAVTKTVQKLVAKGLLKARANATDARSKLLVITPKGSQAIERAVAAIAPALGPAFEGWSEGDVETAFGYLDRLKVKLDGMR
jgi:MarR family transcriptional repressor of emrRAB